MPFGDGTGPRGEGPMTGKGMGSCGGGSRGYGRGFGWRRGFGRGMFGRFYFWGRNNSTKESLAEYRKQLEEELKLVNKEIENGKDNLQG